MKIRLQIMFRLLQVEALKQLLNCLNQVRQVKNKKQVLLPKAELVGFSKHLLDGKHPLTEKFQQDWL